MKDANHIEATVSVPIEINRDLMVRIRDSITAEFCRSLPPRPKRAPMIDPSDPDQCFNWILYEKDDVQKLRLAKIHGDDETASGATHTHLFVAADGDDDLPGVDAVLFAGVIRVRSGVAMVSARSGRLYWALETLGLDAHARRSVYTFAASACACGLAASPETMTRLGITRGVHYDRHADDV